MATCYEGKHQSVIPGGLAVGFLTQEIQCMHEERPT